MEEMGLWGGFYKGIRRKLMEDLRMERWLCNVSWFRMMGKYYVAVIGKQGVTLG